MNALSESFPLRARLSWRHLALLVSGVYVAASASAQSPWGDNPVTVPGRIEAEHFDRGGEGIGYHDVTAGNAGGQYRPAEDVDIIGGPNGSYVVNNSQTGEWLSYSIDVAAEGEYVLELLAATNFDFPDSAYRVEVDGQNLNSVALADSGGWNNFQWLGATNLSLTAGTHALRIITDRQYFNVDALRLQARPGNDEMMPHTEAGWTAFAPRPEKAPTTHVSYDGTDYVLNIQGNGVGHEYGGWRTRIDGLNGNEHYRFQVHARPSGIASLRESVTILLRWRGDFGYRVRPDYVWDFQQTGADLLYFDRLIQAPPGTRSVDVELVLQWAGSGRVDFRNLSFKPVAPPPARPVRAAAVYFRPSGNASGVQSVQAAADYARQVAAQYKPDVMVLGELLNVIGASGSMQSNAESIPGSSTQIIAGVARDHRVNIVVGLLEKSGDELYNTAVLFDRDGSIVGKYHKTQLPLQDASAGIAPGNEIPVFDTDIGKVAMLICHDISFPEPAREARLNGAEIILLPIWGGKSALLRSRAIENSLYVVSSGYDYKSDVINPLGDVLDSVAAANGSPQVAIVDIDLGRRYRENFIGDWRDISGKERRSIPYVYEVP